jgi:GTP-binding protein EngB required for normal cell division
MCKDRLLIFLFRMSRLSIPSSSPRSGSTTASKSASASRTIIIDNCIHRIAIDPYAVLGSFYDARKESVVGKLSLNQSVITKVSQQKDVECVVMKADTFDREELFRKIGIYEEPWLNSILNIVPAEGIASILNYSFPESTNIRFLYYYYSSEEKSIPPVRNTVMAAIPKDIPDIAATHVISAIKLGVQALIVLQLSSDDEMNLGSLIEDIAQRLRSKSRFQISNKEKTLLDRIIVSKIFSNIPTLNSISTLAGICQKITDIKPHTHCHQALEFTLRTIKWFYPLYPNEKAQYTPLEPDVVKIIKRYLGSLSSQIKELKTSLNSADKQTSEKQLHEQYDALQKQIAGVEAMYSTEIEGIRNLVIQIRSRIIEQESIIEKLSDRFTRLLQNNIDPIIERLQSFRKKVKIITELDDQNIKYLNMQHYSIHESDDLNTIFQKLFIEGKSELIFCSTDDLKDQNSSTWNDQFKKWMQERESNFELIFVYADFTYTSYPLPKVKILSIKSMDDVKKQFGSLNLPLQSTLLTSSSDSFNSKREASQAKEPTNLDEQRKQIHESRLSPLEVSNGIDDPSKQVEGPSCPSLPLNELVDKDTSPGTEQVNKVNELSSQPTSNPQSFPQTNKQCTDEKKLHPSPRSEKIASSNEQINHKEEQGDTPLPSMVSPPRTSPRRKQHDSELKEPRMSTPLSLPEKQLRCSSEHDKMSEVPPVLGLNANQIPKNQLEDKKEQSELLSLPISSTPELIQASNKQAKQIKRSMSAATPPVSLNTRRRSLQENQLINIDEQFKSAKLLTGSVSDISITLNQNSSRESDTRNKSPLIEHRNSLDDSTNQSRSSTPSTSGSIARVRRRSARTEKQQNTIQSLNSSTTENTALSNGPRNDEKELSNIPKILSPRAASQTPKESTFIQKPLKPLITTRTPSSEKPSVITDEQPNQLEPKSNHLEMPNESQTPSRLPTPDATQPKRPDSTSPRSSAVKYVNILLLGESGVGKSTFINALVNYLAFETFEEARSNEPLVALPVSFLMTVGDHFEEKIVKFGTIDPNEDHDHPGQSVTQHCRSYVFRIGTQTKLRIIDTPGMGDTRGLEQDDRNMEHILSFINNLSHLNAICILLKPNESRLTVVLRSYFTRFLSFLGENARNNIVFCFTNTRATFFAPGNTGPLLRKMINSLPIKDIPFEKRNTFCFDSESFRYLVALRNNVKFDTYQENEYQQSWTASSTVSNLLIQYICNELKPYSKRQWQSIEHAQFSVKQLIRPMLETTRNILRNITLLKENSSKLLIRLCPIVLTQSSTLCYKCPRIPQRFSDFWILPDTVHTFSNTSEDCDCSKKKHVDVDYKLEYIVAPYEGEQSFEKMKSNFEQLRMTILEFGQFYAYIIDVLKQNDPMLSALKQIIAEEDQIRSEKGAKCLNVTLYNMFIGLKKEYKERRTSSISIHLPVDLPSIYEQIEMISRIDEVNEQMWAIQQAQKIYLKQHEKRIS